MVYEVDKSEATCPRDAIGNKMVPQNSVPHTMEDRRNPYRYVIVACSAAALFFAPATAYSNGVFLFNMRRTGLYDIDSLAWVMATTTLMHAMGGTLGSYLVTLTSCRVVVVLGGLLSLVGFSLSSLVSDIHFMFLTYGIVLGLGRGLVFTGINVNLGFWFKENSSVVSGMVFSGVPLGMFVYPRLVQALTDEYSVYPRLVQALTDEYSVYPRLVQALTDEYSVYPRLVQALTDEYSVYPRLVQALTDEYSVYPRLVQALTDEYSVDNALLIMGGLAFNACACGMLLRTSQFEKERRATEKHDKHLRKGDALKTKIFHGLKRFKTAVLTNATFMWFVIGIFFFDMAFQTIMIFLPDFYNFNGSTPQEAALAASISGVGVLMARSLAGIMTNDPKIGTILLFSGNTGIFAILTLFIYKLVEFQTGRFVYSMCIGIYLSCVFVIIGPTTLQKVGLDNLPYGFGFILFGMGISDLIGPPLAMQVRYLADSYYAVFVFQACLMFAGSVCGFISEMFKETPDVETASPFEKRLLPVTLVIEETSSHPEGHLHDLEEPVLCSEENPKISNMNRQSSEVNPRSPQEKSHSSNTNHLNSDDNLRGEPT